MKSKLWLLGLFLVMGFSGGAKAAYTEADILGVWELTAFFTEDETGARTPWCEGAKGSIAYLPGLMTVSINCESVAEGSGAQDIGGHLFYSGPFEVDNKTGEVIHRVRNYSHISLKRVYRRIIEMSSPNHLKLVGNLGEGKTAIVEWKRLETLKYSSEGVHGVYELVGSENEVPGQGNNIPFCTGFYGTIAFTPGGYTSVSINCGEKQDTSVSEPADQFGRNFFYSGTYQVEDGLVLQQPSNSSELSLIGGTAKRAMSLKGDVLELTGTNGSKFKASWQKRRSFVGL